MARAHQPAHSPHRRCDLVLSAPSCCFSARPVPAAISPLNTVTIHCSPASAWVSAATSHRSHPDEVPGLSPGRPSGHAGSRFRATSCGPALTFAHQGRCPALCNSPGPAHLSPLRFAGRSGQPFGSARICRRASHPAGGFQSRWTVHRRCDAVAGSVSSQGLLRSPALSYPCLTASGCDLPGVEPGGGATRTCQITPRYSGGLSRLPPRKVEVPVL